MIRRRSFIVTILIALFGTLFVYVTSTADQGPAKTNRLTIYTWLDFIPPSLQKKFEDQTNIKLHIDYIDSDEGLEAKLLTGKSEYDIVYPSTPYVFRHIQLNLYKPLNKKDIPNLNNIDQKFITDFQVNDQLYALPYLWGTSGLAYDVEVFEQTFPNEQIDSWSFMFDPEKLKKISTKGVSATASSNELFCAIYFWKGRLITDASSPSIEMSVSIAHKARPYWRVFLTSETAIQALGSGEVALAFIWSGDALVAQKLSSLRKKKIEYIIPKEGALKWIDSLAIPHNAPNASAAYQFINFLLEPEHIAEVTNYVKFANTSSRSKKYIASEILNNKIVYPDGFALDKLHLNKRSHPQFESTMNRHFFKILVGY
jgi:putrescine transport system substrate-binding protein